MLSKLENGSRVGWHLLPVSVCGVLPVLDTAGTSLC